jgi:hypothetical protein
MSGYDPAENPAFKSAAAAWHELCDAATAVARTCTDTDEGPAADPTKLPGATPDAVSAMDQLRTVTLGREARERGIALHEADEAARRVSAALPINLKTMVQGLFAMGGGEPELALTGALLMLNGALHGLDETLAQLDVDEPDQN